MPPFIGFKPIASGTLDMRKLDKAFRDAVHDQGKLFKKELAKTVETWQGDVPTFNINEVQSGDGISVEVVPVGSQEAVNKWIYLDRGTSIRWAVMSPDWKSKTTPNMFQSGAGRGSVLIRGRGAMTSHGIAPRPGIDARNWTLMVQNSYETKFPKLVWNRLQSVSNDLFSRVVAFLCRI